MAWISSSGVTVDIDPFLKSGYKFRKLQLLRSSNDIPKLSVAITCKNVIEYL